MGARAKRYAVRADTLSLVPPLLADGESLFWECNDLRLVIKSASVVAIAVLAELLCFIALILLLSSHSFSVVRSADATAPATQMQQQTLEEKVTLGANKKKSRKTLSFASKK